MAVVIILPKRHNCSNEFPEFLSKKPRKRQIRQNPLDEPLRPPKKIQINPNSRQIIHNILPIIT
jgi:hypothetical protein